MTPFFVTFLLVLISTHMNAQDDFVSPCPRLFVYEGKGNEPDRWYGIVTLLSDSDLASTYVRLIFDKPTLQLGNWFGQVGTKDNKEYLLKNPNHQLKAYVPETVRFYVRYDPNEPPPKLVSFRINAKTVCPEVASTAAPPTTMELQTSGQLDTTSSTMRSSVSGGAGGGDSSDFSPSRLPLNPIISGSVGIQGTCGTVRVPARPLITYGETTVEGEWPWHAALYHSKGINLQYICGGSLISPNHILTAAHCVTKRKTGQPISPDLFTVYLGKYNLYRLSPRVQAITVRKSVAHPEFNATYLYNDLAVLHLDSTAQITDFVRPICLWEDDINLSAVTDKLGTVVGWGADQHGNITENLMQAEMPVVSIATCILSNRDFFSRFISNKNFCAGFRNGTSACTGDSGGGMVFPKNSNRGQDSVIWQLRGIVSLSVALQNEKVVCDTSNYIVFTDVAKHLDWIHEAMRS